MPSMTETGPDKVEGKPAKVKGQPRHRKSFQFPLPVDQITEYKATTKLGKVIPRSEIENILTGYLTGRASDELKKDGGVAGVIAKVLGS